MQLILTKTIQKQLSAVNLSYEDLIHFLGKHILGGTQTPRICSIGLDTSCYKMYLRSAVRGIVFLIHSDNVIYPVYIGSKGDQLADNITKQSIQKYIVQFQKKFEKDISSGNFTSYIL